MKSHEDLCGLGSGHIEEAAPDFGDGEAPGCEARNDAEVVRSVLKGAPEVWIG